MKIWERLRHLLDRPDRTTSQALSRSKRFDGFLSYSHGEDGALAAALEYHLQRFAKPWFRRHAARIFRDESNLSANPALWLTIKHQLDDSRYFIVLASPTAAASRWVKKELCYWLSGGKCEEPRDFEPELLDTSRAGHLLLALSDGEIVSQEGTLCWPQTTALPDFLGKVSLTEPLWIDFRWARAAPAEALTRQNARFVRAIAGLAAPLRGIELNILIGREYQEYRRTLRHAGIAAGALMLLLTIAVILGWQWKQERDVSEAERREAVKQRFTSIAHGLVREAPRQDGPLSVLLASQAYRLNERYGGNASAAVDEALRTILNRSYAWNTYLAADETLRKLQAAPHTWASATAAQKREFASLKESVLNFSGDHVAGRTDSDELRLFRLRDRVYERRNLGYDKAVGEYYFTADGRTLAARCADGIRLWRLDAAPVLGPAEFVALDGVTKFSLSADGSKVLLITATQAIFWTAANPDQTQVVGGIERAETSRRTVCLSDRGDSGVVVSDADQLTIDLFSLHTPGISKRIFAGALPGDFYAGAWLSPDARWLAVAGAKPDGKGTISMWDLQGQTPGPWSLNLLGESARCATFSRDGRWFAVGGSQSGIDGVRRDTGIILCDLQKLSQRPPAKPQAEEDANLASDDPFQPSDGESGPAAVRLICSKFAVTAVQFSSDAQILFSGDGPYVRVWNRLDQKPPQNSLTITRPVPSVLSLAWRETSQKLIVTGDPFHVGEVNLAPSRSAPVELQDPTGNAERSYHALATSSDGTTIVAASFNRLTCWRPGKSERAVATIELAESASDLAFDREGQLLVVGTSTGAIDLYSVSSEFKRVARLGSHSKRGVTAVACDPTSSRAVSGGDDGLVQLWDLRGKEPHRMLGRHQLPVSDVAFVTDGNGVLSTSADGELRHWNLAEPSKNKTLLHSPAALTALAISSDGRQCAASGVDALIRLIHLPSGATQDLGKYPGQVRRMAFSPDNRTLAVAGNASQVQVWNVVTGGRPYRLADSRLEFTDLAFVHGGLKLVTSSSGIPSPMDEGFAGALQVHPTLEGLVDAAARLVWCNLSSAEWNYYVDGDLPLERTFSPWAVPLPAAP